METRELLQVIRSIANKTTPRKRLNAIYSGREKVSAHEKMCLEVMEQIQNLLIEYKIQEN